MDCPKAIVLVPLRLLEILNDPRSSCEDPSFQIFYQEHPPVSFRVPRKHSFSRSLCFKHISFTCIVDDIHLIFAKFYNLKQLSRSKTLNALYLNVDWFHTAIGQAYMQLYSEASLSHGRNLCLYYKLLGIQLMTSKLRCIKINLLLSWHGISDWGLLGIS